MEEQLFNKIRDTFCLKEAKISAGKMMSSEAITFDGKVFAFFSRKKKMVFKLGKEFDPDAHGVEICVFNPFTNRSPLNGWFEIPYSEKDQWIPFTEKALTYLKSTL
jgi:ribosomal protein L24E